jgi:hypothetical protein
VKFNREELRAAVARAIDQHRVDHDAKHERAHAEWVQARAAWVEEYGPAWLEALPKLRAKLRRGQPLTARFSEREPKPTTYYEPSGLLRLAAVLDACADDVVTTTGLATLGIARPALANAVAHLRPATATATSRPNPERTPK